MSAEALTAFAALRRSVARNRVGDGGRETCEALTDALDLGVGELARNMDHGAAVVALGGYGRREQCLHSDVDLMILHEGRDPEPLVRAVLYPLWDANLKVGHAVRTVPDCRSAGEEAFDTLTSLLSARLVAGDAELYQRLMDVVTGLVRKRPLAPRLAHEERRRRQASPYPTMTADLKDGRGALRTHQGAWWERRRAELLGLPSRPPDTEELAAADTLLAIRNALHSAAGRAADRFVIDLRAPAAAWLDSDVRSVAARLTAALDAGDRLADRRWPDIHVEDDELVGLGRRVFTALRSRFSQSGEPPSHDDDRVLALAVRAAARPDGARFESTEEDAIRLTEPRSWTAEDRRDLLTLLSGGARGRSIFDRLRELGWIERELPEWRAVGTAPQIAPFHDHPVGTHLWRTVDEVLTLTRGHDELADIADGLGSTEELILSAFLHDIGKARGGDHELVGADLAAAMLGRFGFGPATTAVVVDTVRNHLLLSETATRRDIADPSIIDDVAAMVGDRRRLDVLYLVTVADLRATGTTMWNEWRATLLQILYERTREAIETGAAPPATEDVDAVVAAGSAGVDRRAVEEHVAAMPTDYLATATPGQVLAHMNAADQLDGPVSITIDPSDPGLVLVAGADRAGFLLAVTRAFTAHGVGIVDARLRTRADGVALDTFRVRNELAGGPVAESVWPEIEARIAEALDVGTDLRPAVRRRAEAYRASPRNTSAPQVTAHRSGPHTVVEVRAPDRVGLLADIVEALGAEGLDVQLAKVDTMGGQARDTFHVRRTGMPIVVDSEREALCRRIRDRLTA